MKAVYFAWVRERIGKAEEELDPPAEVATVGDLIGWLAERGEGYALRLRERRSRSAPRSIAPMSSTTRRIAGAREIAFFPPMTGG